MAATNPTPTALARASLRGLRWTAVTQIAAQVATYGSFVVLARVLAPAEMGVVATAGLVTGLAAVLNEAGMGAALVQRAELSRGHQAACFWTNLAVGLLLWAAIAAVARPLAAFFAVPALAPVLWALAPTFPVVALGVLPKATLERALRFKALGVIEAMAAVATGGTAIALALAGAGVWAVVAGSWAGFGLQLVAYWRAAGVAPGGRFSRAELRDLWGFGANVLGSRVLGYAVANVDYLIVGRLMGPAALGLYALAYKLVTLPLLKVSHLVLRVAFPAFSRITDDEAFRAHYLKMVQALAAVAFPVLVALAAVAPEAIALVFGPAWAPAADVTRIMCVVGACKALAGTIGVVFMSKGRPGTELKLNLFGAVKLPIFLLFGVPFGIGGVAVAYALSSLTGAPLQQHFANRAMGLGWGRYLRALAAPAAAAATMGVALLAWRAAAAGLGDLAMLAGAAPVGAAFYLLGLRLVAGHDLGALARAVAGRSTERMAA